ncbi:MAG: helix-turn-helix transcriptional regulator, partial [Actinomycetota bacterium]|nr:helix-turn-helix transcriptional regulator [Actinomycetota bacterium]
SVAGAVRSGEDDWRAYRRYVDGIESEAREDPEAALARAVKRLRSEILKACEEMSAFGMRIEPEDRCGPPRRWQEVEASKDLTHPREAVAFGDAWWRFTANNDARVYALVAPVGARKRGEEPREAARAACEEIVRVLRSRPLLYGVLAARPPFEGAEIRGLERARAYFAATFAGWIMLETSLQTNKRLRNILKVEGAPRKVLAREITAAVLTEYRQLIQEAGADPERALRELTHEDLGRRVKRALENQGLVKTLPERASAELGAEAGKTDDAALEEFVAKETLRQDVDRFKAWMEEARKKGELKGKQLRVYELTLAGYATADIARLENMAESTVRQHRKRGIDKARKAFGL